MWSISLVTLCIITRRSFDVYNKGFSNYYEILKDQIKKSIRIVIKIARCSGIVKQKALPPGDCIEICTKRRRPQVTPLTFLSQTISSLSPAMKANIATARMG